MGVHEIRSQLYGDIDYVCGGHGARRPSHGMLPDSRGHHGQILRGRHRGPAELGGPESRPGARGEAGRRLRRKRVRAGETTHDYHLYSSKAGGYLNLAMSSRANPRYITTTDKEEGIALSEIVRHVQAECANAVIHWSACRSIEDDGASFGWSTPRYKGKLAALAKRPAGALRAGSARFAALALEDQALVGRRRCPRRSRPAPRRMPLRTASCRRRRRGRPPAAHARRSETARSAVRLPGRGSGGCGA